MITLYGFGRVFRPVIGETRDLRVEWMLEEIGLPYRVHGIDHTGGEHNSPDFRKISPFGLVPAIKDGDFALSESGAILLYLAEKTGKLIPSDFEGRTRVSQWCFASLSTIERPMLELILIDKFGGGEKNSRRPDMIKEAKKCLGWLEDRLEGRDWIATADFTVADLLLATVLRQIRHTDLLNSFPLLKAYYARALSRPAWQRTLEAYAKRLGVKVEEIR